MPTYFLNKFKNPFRIAQNQSYRNSFLNKPIISNHNKSPLFGGKIYNLHLKSLNPFYNKMTNSFESISELVLEMINSLPKPRVFNQKNYGPISTFTKFKPIPPTPFHKPIVNHVFNPPKWKNK